MTACRVSFVDRLRVVESLLWSYAKHYEIKGVLPAEDLYQEALIELDKLITLNPKLEDDVFQQRLRVRLSSRMKDLIRYHRQHCRDWRQTIIEDTESILDNDPSVDSTVTPLPYDIFNHLECEFHPSPEDEYERMQREREADAFIEQVREGLDKEGQWVLSQLLTDEIPEQIVGEFQRVPSHVSEKVIGLIFGWNRSYARRVINRVRKQSRRVISRYKFSTTTLLWSEA